jgi:hypothetical protein
LCETRTSITYSSLGFNTCLYYLAGIQELLWITKICLNYSELLRITLNYLEFFILFSHWVIDFSPGLCWCVFRLCFLTVKSFWFTLNYWELLWIGEITLNYCELIYLFVNCWDFSELLHYLAAVEGYINTWF